MSKAERKLEPGAPEAPERASAQPVRRQKLSVLLVTSDDALWPQIGADLNADLVLKQIDSVDELIASTPADQGAIVLWDARGHSDPAAVLSRLSLHSSRFAVIALDHSSSAGAWGLPLQHRQITALVSLPISGDVLAAALSGAREEVNARTALLGSAGNKSGVGATPPARKVRIFVFVGVLATLIAAGIFVFTRHDADSVKAPTINPNAALPDLATPQQAPAAAPAVAPTVAPTPAALANPADERVDLLIEKAQQAMNDRHFIDPAAGSALTAYREVLAIDPDNGEAHQGLQRLDEILINRVQSALDERKFDVALQSLETARSIDGADSRLADLDDRIANMRAELGPAQILAALNAQNFDRAAQLIDDAARAKSVTPAKLNLLRDEVHRRREEFDVNRFTKLLDVRLQQDRLIEPRNDSAAYYLDQARQAGAGAALLQPETQELLRKLPLALRGAIDQRHFADADRMVAAMRNLGMPATTLSALQHELAVARAQQPAVKTEQPALLELAQLRIGQGKLLEPSNDSALYYINELRTTDPKNPGLAQIAGAVQTQIIDRARAVLDAGDRGKAESLLSLAAGLGASPDVDAFEQKLHQDHGGAAAMPLIPEQSLTRLSKLEVQYPYEALKAGIEGWVEIGFIVTPEGAVSGVRVLNANPTRTFDGAAIKAVKTLHYQPVIQGGKAISIGTQLRVVFRLPK